MDTIFVIIQKKIHWKWHLVNQQLFNLISSWPVENMNNAVNCLYVQVLRFLCLSVSLSLVFSFYV